MHGHFSLLSFQEMRLPIISDMTRHYYIYDSRRQISHQRLENNAPPLPRSAAQCLSSARLPAKPRHHSKMRASPTRIYTPRFSDDARFGLIGETYYFSWQGDDDDI